MRRIRPTYLFVCVAALIALVASCVASARVYVAATAIVAATASALWAATGLGRYADTPTGRLRQHMRRQLRNAKKLFGQNVFTQPWFIVISLNKDAASDALAPFVDPKIRPPNDQPETVQIVVVACVTYVVVPHHFLEPQSLNERKTLLSILRWQRLRRGIHGVVLATDVTELPRSLSVMRQARVFMLALMDAHASRPPAYLLASNCRSIPGFLETFAGAEQKIRDEAWGFLLKDGEHLAGSIPRRFSVLLHKLRGQALNTLAAMDTSQDRAPVYLLPQYLAMLEQPLVQAAQALCGEMPSPLGPWLAGIFLAEAMPTPAQAFYHAQHDPIFAEKSVGQDTGDTPPGVLQQSFSEEVSFAQSQASMMCTDWLLQRDAARQIARADGAPRSLFLRQLFADVLPRDKNLDKARLLPGWRGAFVHLKPQLFVFLTLVGLQTWLAASYVANLGLLTRAEATLAMQQQSGVKKVTAAFLPLIHELLQYHQAAPPLRMRAGLYVGDLIQRPIGKLFVDAVNQAYWAPIFVDDQRHLQDLWAKYQHGLKDLPLHQAPALLEALIVHLLLSGPKEAFEPPLSGRAQDVVRALMGRFGAVNMAVDGAHVEALSLAATYVLAAMPELLLPRHAHQVGQARVLVGTLPVVDVLLETFLNNDAKVFAPLKLDALWRAPMSNLFSTIRVPQAMTRRGYQSRVIAFLRKQSYASDAWAILGHAPEQEAAIAQGVSALYFNRYIETWLQLVDSLRWTAPRSHAEALQQIQAISRGAPTPLARLFAVLADNTRLVDSPADTASMTPTRIGALRAIWPIDNTLVRASIADASDSMLFVGSQRVKDALADFTAFVEPSARDGSQTESPLGAYNEQLLLIKQALINLEDNPKDTEAALLALQRARTTALALIDSVSEHQAQRPRLQAMLLAPLNSSIKAIAKASRTHVGQSWQQTVVVPWRVLANHYPFNPLGVDAHVDDVEAFLRPHDGALWRFVHNTLKEDVVLVGDHYEYEPRLGGILHDAYDVNLLRFLDQARLASEALFADEQAQVDWEVRLQNATGLTEARLDILGQKLRLAGDEVPMGAFVPIRWRGDDHHIGVKLFLRGEDGVVEARQFDGPWALFRLVESGRFEPLGPGSFVVHWQMPHGQGAVSLQVRAKRHAGLFFGASGKGRAPGFLSVLRAKEFVHVGGTKPDI